MSRVVTHDGMLSVRIIMINYNNLWGVRRGVQNTKRVYRGNINDIWKLIRGISQSFVQMGTIINWIGRENQFCSNTIKTGKLLLNHSKNFPSL